jgi:predicted nucleic acid-binding protein
MNDRFFLDTSVFFYTFDNSGSRKSERALEPLESNVGISSEVSVLAGRERLHPPTS